jgi:hypothetical protein
MTFHDGIDPLVVNEAKRPSGDCSRKRTRACSEASEPRFSEREFRCRGSAVSLIACTLAEPSLQRRMWFAATTGLSASGGSTCRGAAGPAESRLRTRPTNESVSRCCFMNVILERTTTLLRSLLIAVRHFIDSASGTTCTLIQPKAISRSSSAACSAALCREASKPLSGGVRFRYNHRIALGFDDGERAALALKGAEGKRLTYRQPDRSDI